MSHAVLIVSVNYNSNHDSMELSNFTSSRAAETQKWHAQSGAQVGEEDGKMTKVHKWAFQRGAEGGTNVVEEGGSQKVHTWQVCEVL